VSLRGLILAALYLWIGLVAYRLLSNDPDPLMTAVWVTAWPVLIAARILYYAAIISLVSLGVAAVIAIAEWRR
jgi:hypothetical protein